VMAAEINPPGIKATRLVMASRRAEKRTATRITDLPF
jgi:hypothetical protein